MKKNTIIILIIASIILLVAAYFIYDNLPSTKEKKTAKTAAQAIEMVENPNSFSSAELNKYLSSDLLAKLNSEEVKKTQAQLKDELGYSSEIKIDKTTLLKQEGNQYFFELTCTRTETYSKYNETHTSGTTFFVTVDRQNSGFVVTSLKEEDDVTQDSL